MHLISCYFLQNNCDLKRKANKKVGQEVVQLCRPEVEGHEELSDI